MNTFDDALKAACKQHGIALDAKETAPELWQAAQTHGAELRQLIEPALARDGYIGGKEFTICDIPWGVHAHRWFGMDYLGLTRPEIPALRDWYNRLCQRPAYQQHIVGCPIA